MKKTFVMLVMLGLVASAGTPAFAYKQLMEKFKELYAAPDSKDASEDFKKLVADAKCNVCHVQGAKSKKERNPFGVALHEVIEEEKFPVKDFNKKPEAYADQIKAIFKKAVEKKAGSTDKTFAERIKAGELPGGDKDGKGLPGAK